jgi:DNA-binding response OmpR family regulator
MSQTSSTPYRILIVEDTQEFADIARIILNRAEIESYHANSGEAAIGYLESDRPDLILLDLTLGDITGWDVLEFVTRKYGENRIPVIVTTAHNDPANRLVGKLQNIASYLVKPFSAQQLVDAVNEVRNRAADHS